MRPGFDPTRRNRNIGTARQGHGQDNRLVIPNPCRADRHWAEQLGPHRRIVRSIRGGCLIDFLIEECRGPSRHHCSVGDVMSILEHLPSADREGLDTIVFRRPTHKQWVLRRAWGRILFDAELPETAFRPKRRGPAIMLEAIDEATVEKWPTALRPLDMAELDRLRGDGHGIVREGRRHVIRMTPTSIRATQLYRTLLHEIGHWVDYRDAVIVPAAGGEQSIVDLADAYFSRPHDERESFAHRYAEAARARLEKFGIIPFEPITDAPAKMDSCG